MILAVGSRSKPFGIENHQFLIGLTKVDARRIPGGWYQTFDSRFLILFPAFTQADHSNIVI